MSVISQGLIGATSKTVFKPALDGVNAAGSFYDKFAPFGLGTVATAANGSVDDRDLAQFCRVAAGTIASGVAAGITNGVTVAAAAGNNWTNDTGVTLAVGDYVWLVGAAATK
jgi:hypothetical protein